MTDVKLVTRRRLLCVALLAFIAFMALVGRTSAQPPVTAPASDDRALSAGRWNVVAVEWDGKPVDPEFLAMIQVVYQPDGAWSVLFKRLPVAEGKSTNHPDESPKTFEMHTLGSQGIPASRYAGIYRLDGDTRVLCIVPEGKPRPDAFASPRRSGRMLVTLKRATEP